MQIPLGLSANPWTTRVFAVETNRPGHQDNDGVNVCVSVSVLESTAVMFVK